MLPSMSEMMALDTGPHERRLSTVPRTGPMTPVAGYSPAHPYVGTPVASATMSPQGAPPAASAASTPGSKPASGAHVSFGGVSTANVRSPATVTGSVAGGASAGGSAAPSAAPSAAASAAGTPQAGAARGAAAGSAVASAGSGAKPTVVRVKSTHVIPWKPMDPEVEAARIDDELRNMTSVDFFMEKINVAWREADANAAMKKEAAERQSRRLVRARL